MSVVLTAVQNLQPYLLPPGEGVGKPEGQKAFASKGHLLSGLSVGRFDNNAPLDEPPIHEYKAFEMGFWDLRNVSTIEVKQFKLFHSY